nr:HIRA-interacting protein 3 isoform X2 [Pongo pygmaeus]
MAREKEMQEFTRSFFRGRPDLSTLTHSIVRRRYLAHSGRSHLEPEEKQALKRLVEEELLKMQVDEAASREDKLDLTKKGKRPPTPCSDLERKRFRFNSESESGSEASSPDYFGPPAKNGVAAEVSPAKAENPRRASKAVEESSDEERQRDLPAQRGEESSEKEEKGYKGKTRRKPVVKKQAPGKTSVSRKQAREESEESEEEPVQRTAKKVEGNKGTESLKESEQESEEEILAGKKEHREEEVREEEKEEDEEKGDWKPRTRSSGRRKSAREERSCKQKSQAKRLLGDSDSEEEQKEAAGSGDDSGRDREPPVQRKSEDRTQLRGGGKRLSGSSEDEEDSGKGEPTAKGSRKMARLGSTSGEESDLEREVSDSEVGGGPQGERKNRSSKKSSRKGRTRSSSSSSDGSPEAKGGKAGSGRRGEDHPAVMRLKRYIRACGAHRNYKKLLGSCCSHKERLSILRAELEALGMKGTPSLEKCRALKEQREEAAEVASLDVANIISGSGRPRRRTAWNPLGEAAPAGELYRRTLDSDEERPRPAPPDWSHMRGIISSDGESN